MNIRQMLFSDMSAVWSVQCDCYQGVLEPESLASLEAKRSASPDSCFVAMDAGKVVGYLISVPWLFGQVPSLNDAVCHIPQDADCLYLHDMAISPKMAGMGMGKALFQAYQAQTSAMGFSKMALTAVGEAEGFWRKIGFKVKQIVLSEAKVADYGGQVTYMYQDC